MSRRQEIENIIIGTLLESTEGENYFTHCRCCLTVDMFSDEANRRIYAIVAEMNAKGKTATTPSDIFAEYGAEVMDVMDAMVEKGVNWSFIHKKVQYNEYWYIERQLSGCEARHTDVTFLDYINLFVKIVFEDERKRYKTAV